MKQIQYVCVLLKEEVVGAVSKGNIPIVYAVPNLIVPDPKDKSDAEKLIQAIENTPELLKIVTDYGLKSDDPVWDSFWQKVRQIELPAFGFSGEEFTKKYNPEQLKNYRISRAKSGDADNVKAFDQWINKNLGQTGLPSFQDWWTLSATKDIGPGAKSLEDVVKSPTKDYGYQHRSHSGTLLGQRPVGSL
jgi:hypothetical protein